MFLTSNRKGYVNKVLVDSRSLSDKKPFSPVLYTNKSTAVYWTGLHGVQCPGCM